MLFKSSKPAVGITSRRSIKNPAKPGTVKHTDYVAAVRQIKAILQSLSDSERRIIDLWRDGVSIAEIARRSDKSLKEVSSVLKSFQKAVLK